MVEVNKDKPFNFSIFLAKWSSLLKNNIYIAKFTSFPFSFTLYYFFNLIFTLNFFLISRLGYFVFYLFGVGIYWLTTNSIPSIYLINILSSYYYFYIFFNKTSTWGVLMVSVFFSFTFPWLNVVQLQNISLPNYFFNLTSHIHTEMLFILTFLEGYKAACLYKPVPSISLWKS